jgi:hypothetical protein
MAAGSTGWLANCCNNIALHPCAPILQCMLARQTRKARTSFSEEKEAKRLLLRYEALARPDPMPESHKVFLLLFVHKKKIRQ